MLGCDFAVAYVGEDTRRIAGERIAPASRAGEDVAKDVSLAAGEQRLRRQPLPPALGLTK
ncbi:MAG: hypothetical protein HY332_07030 [Chloroflexi bacterium]|nr:hypothetical protein [Chloroflexota bacterium]